MQLFPNSGVFFEESHVAATISAAFSVFKSNLEITGLQTSTVSTRQNTVRDAVAARLEVQESFLSGSYSRSTLIAPLSQADIDIFMVLAPEYYSANGQATLLDRLKRVLRERYPKTPEISRNGQAVTITFNDFKVDVVPAFYREGGGYLIPTTYGGGRWIATNPKRHVEISSAANAAHNGDLVPLVKMIKCWNRNISSHFRSFHLEVLMWGIIEGVTISDFPSGARFFFDKARKEVAVQNLDPAGYDGDVGYYISTIEQISTAQSRFETAYNRAIRAEQLTRDGKTRAAIETWRLIFGDKFPAHG